MHPSCTINVRKENASCTKTLFPFIHTYYLPRITQCRIQRYGFRMIGTLINLIRSTLAWLCALSYLRQTCIFRCSHGDKEMEKNCYIHFAVPVVEKTGTCTHTMDERSLTGIWTTVEMKKATKKGYLILDTYCVYDYEYQVFGSKSMAKLKKNNREAPDNQHSHFTKFMSLLLKNKIKYSGRQGMDDKDLDAFLAKLKEDTNIQLTKEELEDNPTARYLAKLQINSFWGRLTINPNRDRNV